SADGLRFVPDHLVHDRHQNGHPEVLKRPGVAVPTLLDPEVDQSELSSVTLRPEEVRSAFVERHDVRVVDVGRDPLLLPPNAAPERPGGALVAIVEKLHPGGRTAAP